MIKKGKRWKKNKWKISQQRKREASKRYKLSNNDKYKSHKEKIKQDYMAWNRMNKRSGKKKKNVGKIKILSIKNIIEKNTKEII